MSTKRKRRPNTRTVRGSADTPTYRMSAQRMACITGSLVALMVILLLAAVVGLMASDGSGSSIGEIWGVVALVAAFGLPVAAAGIFGGLAISPWGWVPGTIFSIGWLALLTHITNDSFHLLYDGQAVGPLIYREQALRATGISGLIVGGALYFVAGWASDVPMWIGGTSGGISTGRVRSRGHDAPAEPLDEP
ncbi:hypothetical protein [Pseudoclavibacter sp. VKM Ac-2867]|uniref:hypothetical protein n=1 Tax=Pseudoclavibacter sp. VKM Ac-2867 TaxID=2783829 RepID=UPI00188D4EFD|nr:hypothetical protein [Pseudoclavibacter sp. VKM Ac-2867]MBF4457639.1 hypothetical protein [Pseudoclavibacter sp. VKM Ac-2867]